MGKQLQIGSKLQEIRTKKGITQEQMATMLQVPLWMYEEIELNHRNVDSDVLSVFAKALKVEEEQLVPIINTALGKIDNHGYGAGIVFGNQYIINTNSKELEKLQIELEQLKEHVKQLLDRLPGV